MAVDVTWLLHDWRKVSVCSGLSIPCKQELEGASQTFQPEFRSSLWDNLKSRLHSVLPDEWAQEVGLQPLCGRFAHGTASRRAAIDLGGSWRVQGCPNAVAGP